MAAINPMEVVVTVTKGGGTTTVGETAAAASVAPSAPTGAVGHVDATDSPARGRPGDTACRFSPAVGELPDNEAALLKVLNAPTSVAQATAAMKKLGRLNGRDVIKDNATWDFAEFHPAIVAMWPTGDATATRCFAVYAVPLRRLLADYYEPRSPDVAMLLDAAVLAYWQCIEASRKTAQNLADAADSYALDRAYRLERVRRSAMKQLMQLFETLQVLTGKAMPSVVELNAVRNVAVASPPRMRARRVSR